MKSIILSCTPAECEKIVNGDMSILVRKVVPKETPFKVYIYETKGKKIECGFHLEDTGITLREPIVFGMHKAKLVKHYTYKGKCQVIGSFICDEVKKYEPHVILCAYYEVNGADVKENLRYNKGTCLSYDDMVKKSNGKPLYGLHIFDLKIYDKPKALWQFYKCGAKPFEELSDTEELCEYCKFPTQGLFLCEGRFCDEAYEVYLDNNFTLTRPPKNYIYVEE